jgi:hypothetical protein
MPTYQSRTTEETWTVTEEEFRVVEAPKATSKPMVEIDVNGRSVTAHRVTLQHEFLDRPTYPDTSEHLKIVNPSPWLQSHFWKDYNHGTETIWLPRVE